MDNHHARTAEKKINNKRELTMPLLSFLGDCLPDEASYVDRDLKTLKQSLSQNRERFQRTYNACKIALQKSIRELCQYGHLPCDNRNMRTHTNNNSHLFKWLEKTFEIHHQSILHKYKRAITVIDSMQSHQKRQNNQSPRCVSEAQQHVALPSERDTYPYEKTCDQLIIINKELQEVTERYRMFFFSHNQYAGFFRNKKDETLQDIIDQIKTQYRQRSLKNLHEIIMNRIEGWIEKTQISQDEGTFTFPAPLVQPIDPFTI